MKRSGLTTCFLAATLFMVTFAAWCAGAEEMKPSSAEARSAKRADELLKRFDKNGDGKLDDDERAEAKETMMREQIDRQMARIAVFPGGLEQFRAQVLEMFDKNRDGRLDDDERAAAQKFAEGLQDPGAAMENSELIKRFDKNGNGRIDPEEQAQIKMYLTELRGLGSGQIRNQLLRRFDRNTDGKIDDSEWAEMEKVVRPRVESNPVQLRRYDKNNDGKLDDNEWAAARVIITQWLNGNGPAALDNENMQEEFRRNPVEEQARLKAVAEDVARRRAIREAQTAGGAPK